MNRRPTSTGTPDIIGAIADGTPVPWDDCDPAALTDADVDSLQLLADVAAAFRRHAAGSERRPDDRVLFRWGPLEVEAELGRGSYGTVYKAYDPWLARHVALKLLPADGGGADGLAEARRLARIRHRNVLLVHGCAVHDGRAGLWSDLIDGRTLGDLVAHDGAFSVEEAARVARDLAHALVAIHRAGLVHGDLKADNVMRENGGRIVLMDFGAGGDERLLADSRVIRSTARYLPPEVLDGEPLTARSDTYALGVLLYVLLTGQLPWSPTDPIALRAAQRDRPPPLDALRDDVPAALATFVQRCIALDARERPADAAAFATQLADAMRAPPVSRRRWPLAAMLAGIGIAAALAVTFVVRAPAPAWEARAEFVRVTSDHESPLRETDTVAVGDRLRLRLSSNRDVHVYVLNEDADGRASVLFPLTPVPDPLVAGTVLQLPGGAGSTLAWQVTDDSSLEEFVVIATLTPLPSLERRLAEWQRATSTTRAVDRVVDVADAPQVDGAQLRDVLTQLDVRDARTTRVWRYAFAHSR